jgi:hypothetical protein
MRKNYLFQKNLYFKTQGGGRTLPTTYPRPPRRRHYIHPALFIRKKGGRRPERDGQTQGGVSDHRREVPAPARGAIKFTQGAGADPRTGAPIPTVATSSSQLPDPRRRGQSAQCGPAGGATSSIQLPVLARSCYKPVLTSDLIFGVLSYFYHYYILVILQTLW